MKKHVLFVSMLAASLALILAWAVTAQEPELEQSSTSAQTASNPLTLYLNLGGDPTTLDPAKTWDTTSGAVVEQLFIGLVDLDDETGEVRPELATSWTVSPDGTVYTFTLRNDVIWSDGNPVTAHDVRYGILRTLDPATASDGAYVLRIIKNAAAYHLGEITDPNQVGVTAMNTTTLRVALEEPASYVLSILSTWIARPMPRWAIEAHGVPTWTEPANIVTSGPYRLTEWAHNDHILLGKNPTYYDAANVQIEQAKMWMVDWYTAWQMYLDGQLDAAQVPLGTSLGPVLRQEVHIKPDPGVYYYGFSVSQEPFDDPLVRKAFVAATSRQGLINSVLYRDSDQPALTFTPPGIFGHVDGYAEGVGIPYNRIQAQQWLAQAGYPDGQGLPPIALSFNTNENNQSVAEYVQDSWYDTLGISVTLQSLPWQDYSDLLNKGQLQVWRNVWFPDYYEAYNYLHDVPLIHSRNALGNWTNATYESLLDQAVREQNPDTRKTLYRQAEEILVESDAVMIPLYHYASRIASKPYLERTYPISTFDIATWRITRVNNIIGTAGGELESYDGNTSIQIPAGAIMDTVIITQSPASGMPPGGILTGIGHVFDVTAVYSSTGQPAHPTQPYTITVQYTDAEKGPAIEDTFGLYGWSEGTGQWSQQGITSSVSATDNLVTAQVDHFSIFAVLGETQRVYLPLVMRNY